MRLSEKINIQSVGIEIYFDKVIRPYKSGILRSKIEAYYQKTKNEKNGARFLENEKQ